MPSQKSFLHRSILHLIAILFVIFNISDIRITGLSNVIPLFDLTIIFYFTIFKSFFGIWFVFLLGLWSDALNGNPLGTTSLCYIMLIKLFVLINHKLMVRENFGHVWRQFMAFCFLFLSLKWLILSILSGGFYSFTNSLVQFILSSALYVIMHKLYDYLSEKLLEN
jgi:hypothetical protein